MLRAETNDHDMIAVFCDHLGLTEEARRERLVKLLEFLEKKEFKNAIAYGKEHGLLSAEEQREYARKFCESEMETRPWKALEMARKYDLVDLAAQAAMQYSEDILEHRSDASAAIDIARHERADDFSYRRRASRLAWGQYISNKNFSTLVELTQEFAEYFTDEERTLAQALLEADKAREEKRWGAYKASHRAS